MEDIDSLDFHTQVAIKQLDVEKTKYKLKYKHLCNLINMLRDEAFKQNDQHMTRMMDLINSLQFQYCNQLLTRQASEFASKTRPQLSK